MLSIKDPPGRGQRGHPVPDLIHSSLLQTKRKRREGGKHEKKREGNKPGKAVPGELSATHLTRIPPRDPHHAAQREQDGGHSTHTATADLFRGESAQETWAPSDQHIFRFVSIETSSHHRMNWLFSKISNELPCICRIRYVIRVILVKCHLHKRTRTHLFPQPLSILSN